VLPLGSCASGTNGCSACGGKYAGLADSDIDFDQDGARVAPWQQASLPLPAGAPKGTLILEVADVGDSSYDTVVRVDRVMLVP
jgi:hypothetical protein